MLVKNTTDILFATTVTSRQPPVPELVLIAKAKLNLVPDGVMTLVEGLPQMAQGPLSANTYAEDDPERVGQPTCLNDFADFKVAAEVLLTGSCYAPRSRWVDELPVKLTVGRWSKSLMVYGHRERRSLVGKLVDARPDRFKTMPLDYAHTYGGRNDPRNPVGMGHKSIELPNVVDPRHGDETLAPASFAPINSQWPQRRKLQGSRYDEAYLKERFPYYAEDFDFRYFMEAPSDQWLQGYLRGDEAVTLANLHPEHPELKTRLPGLRIRAFVNDDRDHFREVSMWLDTLLIDTDDQTATLTWRGLTPMRKHLATDVRAILVAQEALSEKPLPEAHYQQELAAFEADPLNPDALIPAAMKEQLDKLSEADDGGEVSARTEEGRRFGEMLRQAQAHMPAAQRAQLISTVDRAAADEGARKQLQDSLDKLENPDSTPSNDTIPPYIPAVLGGQPRVYLRSQLDRARAQLDKVRAQLHAHLLNASANDRRQIEAKLAELDGFQQQIDDPELKKTDPTLRPISDGSPGPGADLSGQDLSHRDLTGIDLRGAKLDGALLTGANLRGVNLEGASLKGTVLYGADMTESSLRGADLSQSNAAEAQLERADMEGCKLEEAYFKDAKMAGARLPKARGKYAGFPGADLSDATLSDTELPAADFREATLTGCDLSRSQLSHANFQGCTARGCRFTDAQLDQTFFMQADLSEALFTGATGERTFFTNARLDNAKLSYAVLHSVFFDDSKANGANFYAADLRDGRLARAELSGARFDGANLFGADLCDAEVEGCSFRGANLYDAKLLRTAGRDCDFKGANLTMTRFGGKL